MEDLLQLNNMEFKSLTSPIDQISYIQRQFAEHFTFENIDVMLHNDEKITESFLREKILHHKRGGLCYELNGALYLVLRDLELDVYLGVATVWSEGRWMIDRTHTIILFNYNGEMYVIDSGSGTNLTLQQLMIDGDSVTTRAGTFRAHTKDTAKGTVISEVLTKDGWALRYAFDLTEVGWNDLQRIKKLIHTHPESPFNDKILIAGLTDNGTVSITNDRINKKEANGNEYRQLINNKEQLLVVIKHYSSTSTYHAAKQYITMYNK